MAEEYVVDGIEMKDDRSVSEWSQEILPKQQQESYNRMFFWTVTAVLVANAILSGTLGVYDSLYLDSIEGSIIFIFVEFFSTIHSIALIFFFLGLFFQSEITQDAVSGKKFHKFRKVIRRIVPFNFIWLVAQIISDCTGWIQDAKDAGMPASTPSPSRLHYGSVNRFYLGIPVILTDIACLLIIPAVLSHYSRVKKVHKEFEDIAEDNQAPKTNYIFIWIDATSRILFPLLTFFQSIIYVIIITLNLVTILNYEYQKTDYIVASATVRTLSLAFSIILLLIYIFSHKRIRIGSFVIPFPKVFMIFEVHLRNSIGMIVGFLFYESFTNCCFFVANTLLFYYQKQGSFLEYQIYPYLFVADLFLLTVNFMEFFIYPFLFKNLSYIVVHQQNKQT